MYRRTCLLVRYELLLSTTDYTVLRRCPNRGTPSALCTYLLIHSIYIATLVDRILSRSRRLRAVHRISTGKRQTTFFSLSLEYNAYHDLYSIGPLARVLLRWSFVEGEMSIE